MSEVQSVSFEIADYQVFVDSTGHLEIYWEEYATGKDVVLKLTKKQCKEIIEVLQRVQ